ncbi:MAG: biotin--[acetyl-CoA-carboxylase] ligase, partial [Chloroflexota bacterium]|nr:biotin--[acetyl-CoA-carboxylase] ligase [Chloroflexota bacterium]
LGRAWLSPPGVNLMVSVAVRPRIAAAAAWQIGCATALSVCAATADMAAPWIKWPNDLYTADGLKLGGILVETALDGANLAYAVIGLGVNVNWRRADMPPDVRETATSLCELAGRDVSRVAMLERYLAALDGELAALERGVSPIPRVRERSWLDGRRVAVDAAGGEVAGEAVGIRDDGALLVRGAFGVHAVLFGDVVHVTTTGPVAA